jgi:hypothetical protein
VSDVGLSQVSNTSAIDNKADARLGTPVAAATAPAAATPATPAGEKPTANNGTPQIPGSPVANQQALPTNHPLTADQLKAYKKDQIRQFKLAKKNAEAAQKAAAKTGTKPATTPAATTTPAPVTPATPGSPQ